MKTNPTQTTKGRLTSKVLAALAFFLLIGTTAMAQVTYTDTVCNGSQDVAYGITAADPTSTYTWHISTPGAGTIDNSISANSATIEIDWGTTSGTYTLYAYEITSDGCLGDSLQLDVVIFDLPTATITATSVCEDEESDLTITLTGIAPWTVDYTDGTNNFTVTVASSPHTVTLPAYTVSQTVTITGVTDASTCDAAAAGLPTTPVTIFPKPATGPIYHF